MTDYKPQDAPGTIRRLDFENIGGDDYSRYTRTQKGLVREALTPKLSVPLSREGTTLNEYVDRPQLSAAVASRNILIRLVVFQYPLLKIQKALLQLITSNTVVHQLFQTKYDRDAVAVSPEVYNNG